MLRFKSQLFIDECHHVFCFYLFWQLMEKQRLTNFVDSLLSKLNYFDELENVRFRCHLPRYSFQCNIVLAFRQAVST